MAEEHFDDQDPVYFPNVPVRAVPASNGEWETSKLPMTRDDLPKIPENNVFHVEMVSRHSLS